MQSHPNAVDASLAAPGQISGPQAGSQARARVTSRVLGSVDAVETPTRPRSGLAKQRSNIQGLFTNAVSLLDDRVVVVGNIVIRRYHVRRRDARARAHHIIVVGVVGHAAAVLAHARDELHDVVANL